MFDLTDKPIDTSRLKALLADDSAGALITFEGVVRDHNEGKSVKSLDYEAYEPLCRAEAQRIFNEVLLRFAIIKFVLVHRVGPLAVGDGAVFVGVSAAHRDQAYLASRYIIDEAKKRLPIWKKEHYTDASSAWVNCQHDQHSDLISDLTNNLSSDLTSDLTSEVTSESVQCVS